MPGDHYKGAVAETSLLLRSYRSGEFVWFGRGTFAPAVAA